MSADHHPIEALDRAAKACGNMTALAEKLGIPQSLPFMWRARKRVPAEHCPAIERATEGAVRCEELRPDVAWDVLRREAA